MRRREFIESAATAALFLHPNPLLGLSRAPRLTTDVNQSGTRAGQARDFFYRPEGAWAADFIPFYKDGRFRLFYLHDWRDKAKHGEGTPWYQVSTDDFVRFREHGEMLPRGSEKDQDLYVFTGSVIEGQGHYHIFYTGHNPYFRKQGKPEQGVMHAVSDDLLQWRKIPGDTFFAPVGRFEPHDWRDPFVFWNKAAGEYWMLLAARLQTGPSRRRGCTALCASKDLKKWEVREPFWTPGLYYTHECPDLFQIGDWWYLVFSEFTSQVRTHYRMSRSLSGPWLTPGDDNFDGRAFYAAKTASDGRRRFIFGWDPTRLDRKDYCRWDWGGNLVVHELSQERDGALSVKVPDTVDHAFGRQLLFKFTPGVGMVQTDSNEVRISAPGSFGCAAAGTMPSRCRIDATIEFEEGTRACGLMLRASDDLDLAYYVRLEPQNQRLVFDSWPRGCTSDHAIANAEGDFMPGLDRPVGLAARNPIRAEDVHRRYRGGYLRSGKNCAEHEDVQSA